LAKIKKIEPRTNQFIMEYERLNKENRLPSNVKLAEIMGIKSKSSVTEILAKRQNIQPAAWDKFRAHFNIKDSKSPEISVSPGNGDISTLIKSNADLAESNKALAFSHAELVLMLKAERNVPSSSLSRVERTNREIVSFLMAFAGIDKESQKSLSDEELIKKIEEMGRDIAVQARKNRENDKLLHGRKGKSERAHES
jgi:hypothetical protein